MTMPLARALIGRVARAGGADWPARKSAFDSATSRYPQYPAEPRTGKYFVRRVGTFEAPRTRTACTRLHRPLTFSPFLPSRSSSLVSFPSHSIFPEIFDAKTKISRVVDRRYSRPLRLASSRAREKTACHLSESFPRGCHARPAFFPSFLAFYRRTAFYMLRLRFVRASSLCSVNPRFAQCPFVDFYGFFDGLSTRVHERQLSRQPRW